MPEKTGSLKERGAKGELQDTVHSSDDLPLWLAINDRPWTVPRNLLMESYQRYGSISPLWQSSEKYFMGTEGSEKLLSNLHRYASTDTLSQYRKDVDVCRQRGIEIIRLVDRKYPEQLRNLTETTIGPPLVLFKRGSLAVFDRCVAISGTRDCSFYGRNFAMEAAQALASKEYIVVSGLARGIDEWAH